jgi:hypothetical protein
MSLAQIIRFLKKISKRLTIFDYISIALAAGVIVILGLFFFRRLEWVEVEVKVAPADFFWSEKQPPYWLANNLSVGDSELDSLGRKVVEVTEVRVFEREEDKKVIYLRLKLRAVKDSRKKQYRFKSKPLAIGESVELQLSNIFLNGLVIYIEGVPDTRVWEEKVVEAKVAHWSEIFPETLGMLPWRAEAIKIGDEMGDTQGRVVAEVLDKKVKPAEKVVVTDDGRVLLRRDPIKKDVTLTVKLKTFKQEGVNYFLDDIKVKVGSPFLLALPEIDIWPEITKIIE